MMDKNQVAEGPASAVGQRIHFLRKQLAAIETAINATPTRCRAYKRTLAKSLAISTDVLRDLGALVIDQGTRGAA
jgi:hypothetical protein